jgi:osmoprotectant transport system ATP-binding protein
MDGNNSSPPNTEIAIEFANVSFRHPNGPLALDGFSIAIERGEALALVGRSGTGKTTVLKLINHLLPPQSGVVRVEGRATSDWDPIQLRRRIGYVLQEVGLFPHMTIGRNVAVVPRLEGWPEDRIRARVDELLNLVGLNPKTYADRYPRELSGGQRQRVGVARALAADPPVMLMDEPFGAIDPIARGRLQDEFKDILRRVRKTIVIVTHDLDEAIKMGHRIAIMKEGRLVQHDTPDAVLARPANDFVETFVGRDRALKRLGLMTVDDLMTPVSYGSGPTVTLGTSLRDALSVFLATSSPAVTVVGAKGEPVGQISRDAIFDVQKPKHGRQELPA